MEKLLISLLLIGFSVVSNAKLPDLNDPKEVQEIRENVNFMKAAEELYDYLEKREIYMRNVVDYHSGDVLGNRELIINTLTHINPAYQGRYKEVNCTKSKYPYQDKKVFSNILGDIVTYKNKYIMFISYNDEIESQFSPFDIDIIKKNDCTVYLSEPEKEESGISGFFNSLFK